MTTVIGPAVSAPLGGGASFDERLATREARLGIVGLGYAGLPLAMLFAEAGFAVTGIPE
jgi:UDP-N-acetyl-D-glucosamine dehydrogenase